MRAITHLRTLILPAVAVGLALLIGALLISMVDMSPGAAYAKLLQGALGVNPAWTPGTPLVLLVNRPARLGSSLTEAIPLILAGLAVALPFRCGLLNIGGEGQLYMGGLGATLAGLSLTTLPPTAALICTLLAAIGFGAAWGALAGLLRAARGLNEIISTIMLNFIAFWLVSGLVHGPLKDTASFGYDWSPEVPVQLPVLIDKIGVTFGFPLAIAAVLLVGLLLWRTSLGFELRAIGANPATARFAGMRVGRGIVLSMALAGGLAGLAGGCVILGVQHRLSDFFSPGYGLDAIAVALVGGAHPLGVLASGLFFGALRTGAQSMELSLGVPRAIAQLIQALTLLFVIVGQSAAIARWIARYGKQKPSPPTPLPPGEGSHSQSESPSTWGRGI